MHLKNGEVYALDLSGAQFGNYQPVISWKEYREKIIRRLNVSELLGRWREKELESGRQLLVNLPNSKWYPNFEIQKFANFVGRF